MPQEVTFLVCNTTQEFKYSYDERMQVTSTAELAYCKPALTDSMLWIAEVIKQFILIKLWYKPNKN